MESSSRGRTKGIGEEPIAEGSLVRVRVREVRRANAVVNGDRGAYGQHDDLGIECMEKKDSSSQFQVLGILKLRYRE